MGLKLSEGRLEFRGRNRRLINVYMAFKILEESKHLGSTEGGSAAEKGGCGGGRRGAGVRGAVPCSAVGNSGRKCFSRHVMQRKHYRSAYHGRTVKRLL